MSVAQVRQVGSRKLYVGNFLAKFISQVVPSRRWVRNETFSSFSYSLCTNELPAPYDGVTNLKLIRVVSK